MGLFYRSRDRHDPWLTWKMAFLGLAAIAFFFGVRLAQRWLIWVAVGLLVVGFVLRFVTLQEEDDDAGDS